MAYWWLAFPVFLGLRASHCGPTTSVIMATTATTAAGSSPTGAKRSWRLTEGVACSSKLHWNLAQVSGGPFGRVEARVIAENGLYTLAENGYLRLDARGKIELQEHDHTNYGLGDVQWLLTAKAAKTMAPAYCTIKGLPSECQAQAVKDMLAANKAAVKAARAPQPKVKKTN